MTDFGRTKRDFEIGRVLERTFGTVGFNFVSFILLALLFTGIPQIILGVVGVLRNLDPSEIYAVSNLPWHGLDFVVGIATSAILQSAVIHGAFADMRGGRASFADCMATGMRHLLPVAVIGILQGVGIAFGFILLIIPGIFLAIAWSVVVPVRVVEGKGILEVFSRSWKLTEGSRWPLLGLFFVFLLVMFAFGVVFTLITGAISIFTGGLTPQSGLYVGVVLGALTNAFAAMIGAALIASTYFELRSRKEGVGIEEMASLFD